MNNLAIIDRHPACQAIQDEILASLNQPLKHLPSKYLYDTRGADLFEQICDLPEYYPTRTEVAILDQQLEEIALALGPNRWVVEPGSGSGLKTRMLLEALEQPAGYVPIDISKAQLKTYSAELRQLYPSLPLRPVCADFMRPLDLPAEARDPIIWFPGSTIGNFSHEMAGEFLSGLHRWSDGGAELLIGVDLVKPIDTLEAAYDDAQGVTAQFNLNLLNHLNDVAECDFQAQHFRHRARWNPQLSAIQMFLVSQKAQQVQIGDECISLAQDEPICTEYSHKYSVEQFAVLAANSGWQLQHSHSDANNWFSVLHLSQAQSPTSAQPETS